MNKLTLTALLLGGLLGAGRASAQATASAAWFEVNNNELLLKTSTDSRPISKSLSLPNGTYLDNLKKVATLADGTRIELHEGDAVSLNGDITLAKRRTAPPVAAAPAPAPTPEPAAPAAPVATAATPAFTYEAPAPVNGKLKGVVELGASGFNSFIVKMDNRRNWHLEKSEFGASLVMENMTDENEVKQVLKGYIAKMLDYGVGGTDIHFMVSSGAMKADVTPRIVRALKSLGYVVNTVTPEREGSLGLRALLPAEYASKAFVVDIGSANTKISWLEDGQVVSREVVGAKYYEKGMSDEAAAEAVQVAAKQVPAALRQTCFIIGGSPYEMAKKVRQGQARYSVLAAPASYHFDTAKGKSGVVIYQALAEATGCKQFVFDADSNFTIGYLLTLQQVAVAK